jgi:tRNA(Ile)-lysidine synthase
MQALHDRVLRTIREHALIPAGGRVLVAVSGGADSVALVHILKELAEAVPFTLAGLAHLNHQLRGVAADEDERFCRELAASLETAFIGDTCDVGMLAAAQRVSVEAAAHRARRAFFEKAAAGLDTAGVAVGHTRDDLAETFLLRLMRGAGPRGLAGMFPRHGVVIRPLLECRRLELREYVAARGLPFQEDETNADLRIPRNRVRHRLIPFLEREFSPGIVNVLAREADIAREDAAWLDRLTSEAVGRAVVPAPAGSGLRASVLAAEPAPLARRLVQRLLESTSGGRTAGFDHLEAVLELAREPGGEDGVIDLPGVQATRTGDLIVLTARSGRVAPPRAAAAPGPEPLPVPGEARLPGAIWTVSARFGPPPANRRVESADDHHVAVEAAALRLPLAIRRRRPGDALRPLGLGGRKKVQDIMVDRKIPRAERDAIPLVVDAADRIVWVVGHALAEDFRITDATTGVVILTARATGGAV